MHNFFLCGFMDIHFAGDAAIAHDDDTVAHTEDLRHFRRNEDDRDPFLFQAVHDVVNFNLCGNIDTARRFVEDDHTGITGQPFTHNDLLLVAAGQTRRIDLGIRHFDLEVLGGRLHHLCLF